MTDTDTHIDTHIDTDTARETEVPSAVSDVSAMLIAHVERELAAMRAEDEAAAAADAADAAEAAAATAAAAARDRSAVRRGNGSSVVFTVRLDRRELEALQRRAAARGLPPSVLARNLIRIGGQPPRPGDGSAQALEALEAAEAALAAVRAALASH